MLLPIAVFLFVYWRRRDVYDLHHAILGEIHDHSFLSSIGDTCMQLAEVNWNILQVCFTLS